MSQEVNNKIKLISEMLSIYQNTILKEKDLENLKLIKKDIDNKRIELEDIKKDLDNELNILYENGANEIDLEINQLQIVINEVNELLDEIVPDILSYIKVSESQKYNIVKIQKGEENDEIKNSLQEQQPIVKKSNKQSTSSEKKIEKNPRETIQINNIENEKKIENDKIEKNVNEDKFGNVIEKSIKVEPQNNEVILPKKEIISDVKKDDGFILEEIPEEELYIAPRRTVAKNIIKSKIKIQDSAEKTIVNFKENQTKKVEMYNTITIKQPSDNYRNVASNIVSNRLKNLNSPENAIQKAHNAAESVMNSIIENLKNNNN